jgi:aspartate aminotransferase
MPELSQKGISMPASPIRKLVPYADGAVERGIRIYHLNIGQPDIKTPEALWERMHQIDRKILEYSPSNGFASLRKKYAAFLDQSREGVHITADDLMITTGGSEALLFTFLSTLDEGDEIIIPEPMYANYIGFSRAGSIVIKPLTCHFDDQFALPPTDAFEALISERTKAILICNPNNPTGYVYSNAELNRLAAIAKKHDLFLIVDEVYREFIYEEGKHLSVLDLPGMEEHAILIDSVSKRFSACGARIGAIVTKNHGVLRTAMKFAQQRLSPPTLAQVGCEALFDHVDESYFHEVDEEYTQRRNLLVETLNAIPGVWCPTPKGAFYAIARLPIDDSDTFCQWLLESFEFHGETVMLAPATGFYATPGLGKDEVRMAYVLNREDLARALLCLKEALKIYPGRTN